MSDNRCSADIKSVVIYGSHARGDADIESDLDICVFTAAKVMVEKARVAALLPMPHGSQLSVTTYCQNDLTAMMEYGSLFLWHLKLEGCIIFGKEHLASQFAMLRPFERHHEEIAYHLAIFSDLITTRSALCTANEFDLALLFTIARNTCMVLSHKAGVPAFGRHTCYYAAASAFRDLPLDEATYLKLSRWKGVYERGTNINGALPPPDEMTRLLALVQDLLEYAGAHAR